MSTLPRCISFSVTSHVLFILLLTLSLHFTSSFAQPLTGELCFLFGTPCKSPRQCVNVSNSQKCTSNQCICFNRSTALCSPVDTTCPDGEACVGANPTTGVSTRQYLCLSCRLINNNLVNGEPVLPDACPTTTPTPRPPGMGYTLDACDRTVDCATPRICRRLPGFSNNGRNLDCSSIGSMCYCLLASFQNCLLGQLCADGEVCAERSTSRNPICVSKNVVLDSPQWRLVTSDRMLTLPSATPTPTPFGFSVNGQDDNSTANGSDSIAAPTVTGPVLPGGVIGNSTTDISPSPSLTGGLPSSDDSEEQAVCIAQHHLNGIQRQDLVYTKMRRATVLCDVDGSCATAGHIVILHGESMTMRRYCERVGCARRRMWVNSPRMRRGVRVGSLTHGLQFSALAARFEVRGEGRLLGLLVRLGF